MIKKDVIIGISIPIFLIFLTIYSFVIGYKIFSFIFMIFTMWAFSCIRVTKTTHNHGKSNSPKTKAEGTYDAD